MIEDLQYEMVRKMKKWEDDYTYEGYIAAFEFPLVIDGDWNPYIFELTKTSREEFIVHPDNHKIPFILKSYLEKHPNVPFFDRASEYRKKYLGRPR